MKKFLTRLIYIVSIVLFISSAVYIFKYYYDMNNTKEEKKLLNELYSPENNTIQEENVVKEEKKIKTDRMSKLETLQKQNSDIIGWIEIEDTDINYPVVQGSDNSYYLNHNYKKKYSVNGAIFLDKDYSWNPPSSNLLIYGHHSTFKDLLKYANKNFFIKHKTLRFTTKDEDVKYQILAVFRSKVYYQSEKNVFRYYYFINAKNESEYNKYVSDAKKASLYDTGVTASYGEQLITLSTCSYHTKDGRFVVVAKKEQ